MDLHKLELELNNLIYRAREIHHELLEILVVASDLQKQLDKLKEEKKENKGDVT